MLDRLVSVDVREGEYRDTVIINTQTCQPQYYKMGTSMFRFLFCSIKSKGVDWKLNYLSIPALQTMAPGWENFCFIFFNKELARKEN